MRGFLVILGATLAVRHHPTPIESYTAGYAYLFKEFPLSHIEETQLMTQIVKPANLEALFQNKVIFDTSFLKKSKPDHQKRLEIVRNYLNRFEIRSLTSIHDIIDFFYDKRGELLPVGPAFSKIEEEGINLKECMYEVVSWWLDSTPGGRPTVRLLLDRFQGGAMDDELYPFLTHLTNSIRRYDPFYLTEMDEVLRTIQSDFEVFPDPLYSSILNMLLPSDS